MRIFTLLAAFFIVVLVQAQVVTSDPAFPTVSEPITIYFNADQGSAELKDFSGEVYVHTGLITGNSSSDTDWKYVISDWGENIDKNKMERISANLYKFTINPDILTFYEVDPGVEVLKIALVFRNADGSLTGKTADGKDIYVEVFTDVVNVKIESPEKNEIVKLGETQEVSVSSNLANETALYINDVEVEKTTGNAIVFSWTPENKGNYKLKAVATDGAITVVDSVEVLVYENTNVASLPAGLKNGVNIGTNGEVTFVLHAPHKQTAILKGDMSSWLLKEEYIMNRNPENTHFWLTVKGLDPNFEYAYQYVVDGTITIADPYTEKVLDPWNDKYIEEETYPNLKAYPEGLTSEIASTFIINENAYQWEVEEFSPPTKTDLVIYELHLRDFIEAHNYSTLTDTLNYLKKLGINAVELMPVNEFEGNDSWGYNPSFYFALDKYYGTKNEFKRFVDSCHANGIAVIIDMVLNHSFGQSPLLRLYANGYTPTADNPWYNVSSPNPDYYWGVDFNHERKVVQEFVDSVNSYWLNEYKVDGFRFDFTKGFTQKYGNGWDYDQSRIDILKRMSSEIWERNPNAYVILEHLTDNSEEKVLADYGILLWGNMNHNYAEGAMGYNSGSKSDYNWGAYSSRDWNEPSLVTYMESHDEERVQYKNTQWGNGSEDAMYKITNDTIGWKRLELNACFFFTIPGPKMIWQFGELGYDYSIDYNGRVGRKPIRWDYYENTRRKRVYDVYSVLTDLKVNLPVFETENFTMDTRGDIKRISLFHETMDVFVLGNFNVVEEEVEAEFPQTGTWYELFSQTQFDVSDSLMTVKLLPGEYRLFSTQKIEYSGLPEFEGGSLVEYPMENEVEVYPIPSREYISVKNYRDAVELSIYHVSGDLCIQLEGTQIQEQIDIKSLKSGMYIIRVKNTKGDLLSGKFIVN